MLLTSGRRLAAQASEAARFDAGRFTVVAFPHDELLARSILSSATDRDSFPGLPLPRARVIIAIAPDADRFRDWIGPSAPEWGAAIAFPAQQRVIMQGRKASSAAGDPMRVLRHELAHLALHEALGELPPRWFDEGYASFAAGEWGRDDVLAASIALVVRGVPSIDSLDNGFEGGAARADAAYALAYRAVAELAALDPERGLSLFFRYWQDTNSLDRAIRAAYGMTAHQFDHHFRERTLRRYGAIAVVTNISLGAGLIVLLVLPFHLMRRRRLRRRLASMVAADEAAERAARESALDALLGTVPPSPGATDATTTPTPG